MVNVHFQIYLTIVFICKKMIDRQKIGCYNPAKLKIVFRCIVV